jgi:hypothetical protein
MLNFLNVEIYAHITKKCILYYKINLIICKSAFLFRLKTTDYFG